MAQMRSQLQAALNALYYNTDPSAKEQASRWLEGWQQSTEAWTLAHEVLQDESAQLEAHYLCAQTLRTKITRDFEELPPGTEIPLRDSLVALLLRYAKGRPQVRTQLCLALAGMVCHMPAQHWGEGGPVEWFARHLNVPSMSQPSEVSLNALLEVLTVLPQEAGGYQPSLRPERRRQLREEMEASFPRALAFLSECHSRAVLGRQREQAMEAFAAWLKLGCDTPSLSLSAVISSSPLTAAALGGLTSQEAFYGSVEAVVELIYCTSEGGRPRQEMTSLVQSIVQRVMELRPRFHVCIAAAVAEREGSGLSGHGEASFGGDYEEDAKAIARLFAEIGEAYTELIAGGGTEVMAPVEAALEVASYPDNDVCAISYNFWHRLSRAVTVGLVPQPLFYDAPALGAEESQQRVVRFTPAFRRLVELIRGRVRFPDDYESWHTDEKGEFRRGRVAVGDTLIDAAAVLGGAEIARLLIEPLMAISARVSNGGEFDWKAAEAALYCIRSVHMSAPPPGDVLLLSLFGALATLPAAPKLQYTASLTIGAYADWLAESVARMEGPSGFQLLSSLMSFLIRSLSHADCAAAAALSLKRLCEQCARSLTPTFQMLFDLYKGVQTQESRTQHNLDAMEEEDVENIIEAVTLVASAIETPSERRVWVQRLLDVVVQPIQTILSASSPPLPQPSTLLPLLPLVDRVTTIFRVVRDPEDVGEALVRLWPWLEAALDAFGPQDSVAAEKICHVPRMAIKTAGTITAPALPKLCVGITTRFESTCHSCYLYLANEIIKTFGNNDRLSDAADPVLLPMLERLLTSACARLSTLRDVTANPDVADDAFLLAGRALNYAPRLVLTQSLLPTLLVTAKAGLLVQHREACGSIATFMMRLLDPATLRKCPPDAANHLNAALGPVAPDMVRLALAGAVGALPTSRLQEMTDVLYSLLKVAAATGLEWIAAVISLLPPESALPADTRRFLSVCETVVREGMAIDNEREFMSALGELSDCCRRNRRAQTFALKALLPAELQYLVG
jgi:transportin-3